MLAAKADLPMEGRPARISRSDLCSPPSFWSRSISPVDMPANPPSREKASGVISTAPCSESAKGLEAGGGAAGLGQGVELLLGLLDLVAGFGLGVLDGGVGHLAADTQHLAPEGQVVDDAGVVGGVGGGGRAVHQVGEVA